MKDTKHSSRTKKTATRTSQASSFVKLQPLLKWAGGKEKELKYIIPNLPPTFENYYEPFVGGGAVYTAIHARKYFINDRSEELIAFYQCLIHKSREAFFTTLEEMGAAWEMLNTFIQNNFLFFSETYRAYVEEKTTHEGLKTVMAAFVTSHEKNLYAIFPCTLQYNMSNLLVEIKTNLIRKIKRMKQITDQQHPLSDSYIFDNIETALKSAFYMHIRYLYNHQQELEISPPAQAAIFFFIRSFAYSGMFRYNASGYFNVPYGGITYNRKQFDKKVAYLQSDALQSLLRNTVIEKLDFADFLKRYPPSDKDFLFVDPPYDSEFSMYMQHEFTKDDQARLAHYLIDKCPAKWMMIIKNTDFIYKLYANKNLRMQSFGKTYLVSFMNRNDKHAEHLLITNY